MRKPMVTRTFNTLVCTATVLDTEKKTVAEKQLKLSRVYAPEKILGKLQETYNTDTEVVVHVTDVATVEECYGMSEDVFLSYAHKIDAKTRKAVDENGTEETADNGTEETTDNGANEN